MQAHEYFYADNEDTVDYWIMFRQDVTCIQSSLLLISDILYESVLPSWRTMLDAAFNLVNFEEEPLCTGDVCVHRFCQGLVHQLATFVEQCAHTVDTLNPQNSVPHDQQRTEEAFADALLSVFAFGSHFLGEEQCRDRDIPAMMDTLRPFAPSPFPTQLHEALRQHDHIWLHTFGEVAVAGNEEEDLE